MAIAPPSQVVGVTRAPLPFGLFSVVPFREGSTDRWESGVEFESLGCLPPLKGVGEICTLEDDPEDPDGPQIPADTVGLPKTFDEQGTDWGVAEPFLIYEEFLCSPFGGSLERAQEIARARLESREEIRAEQALSTGAFGQSPNFTDATDLPASENLKQAVALLEQTIASEYGAQGILHMSRATALLALERGVLERNGQRLSTKLGTPVVAGGGYAFEGIIATPAMFGYRSETIEPSSRVGDLLDRSSNDLYGIAERSYLIAIDPCGMWRATFPTSEDDPGAP